MTNVALAPRKLRSFGKTEIVHALATLVSAIAVTAVIFAITPFSGTLGFVVVAYCLFLVGTYIVGRVTVNRNVGADRVATVLMHTAAFVVLGVLALIVYLPLSKGLKTVRPGFLTNTLDGIDPSAPVSEGGALHAIVGTLSQVGIATLVSVPFGILTAVYLNEIKGRFAPIVRVLVDAMSGIPSIVAGLFIYAIWIVGLNAGYSGLAASLALGILMLPTVARTSEEMLKLVNPSLREASLALGSPEWRTVLQVVLPTARTGLITATILGIARVAGETAPLIMTSFGSDGVVGPVQGLSNPQTSLPLFVYQRFLQGDTSRAWGAAVVLVVIVVLLFAAARILSKPRSR